MLQTEKEESRFSPGQLREDSQSKIVCLNEFTKAVTVVSFDETKSRIDDISFEGDRLLVAAISRLKQDFAEVWYYD